jgi:hypothetical protein
VGPDIGACIGIGCDTGAPTGPRNADWSPDCGIAQPATVNHSEPASDQTVSW